MNFLSNYGLVSRGMNEAADAQNRLELERQQVETGRIGLEELKRQRGNEAAYREAVSTANPEGGRIGNYHQVAQAALARGDLDTYERAQEASRKMQDEGFGELAMAALTGQPTDKAEENFNARGIHRILPGSVQYGRVPKTDDPLPDGVQVGDILVKAKKPTGEDLPPFNASAYARMHGIIKTQVHPIGRGGAAITDTTGKTTVIPAQTEFPASQSVIHVERNVDGEKKTYAYDTKTKQWIGGAPPGEEGAPPEAESGANVRRNLPVLKAVNEAISRIPGTVNKMDLSDPLHPYYEWTEKGQALATRAQRLYLANPNLPPEQVRDILLAPGLQALYYGGQELALRTRDGRVYKLSGHNVAAATPATPQSAPQRTQPTSPTSTPTATPTPAAAPAPRAPAPTPPRPGLQPTTSDESLPEVVAPRGAPLSPKEQHQSRVAAEQARLKAERDARAAQRPVDTFRAIASSPSMSRDDIPLIEEAIATGKLTPAEELKAHRMLQKLRPGFRRGGRVARYGLGGR